MNILIIAAGEQPSANLVKENIKNNDYLIAVDNGLEVFFKLDIVPNVIVGDMDSTSPDILENEKYKNVKKLLLPQHKNETDTHMALEEAFKLNPSKITLLGALGKRVDHTLSNIMLLKYACKKKHNLIIEDDEQVLYVVNKDSNLHGKKGQTISLLPVDSYAIITARGLEYPLDNLRLTNSQPRGVSNVFLQDKAFISTKHYVLVCLAKMI